MIRKELELNAPESEFSFTFTQGMVDRMAVSYYKYGLVSEAYPNRVNAIESLLLRLKKYEETGNTEYLMDAANFAMIEYMHPKHPKAYFASTDSDGSPGRAWNSGTITDSANTASREKTGAVDQIVPPLAAFISRRAIE